jgi:hypothetical protein
MICVDLTRALALGAVLLFGCDRICGSDENTNVAGDWLLVGEAECLAQEGISSEVVVDAQLSLPIAQSAGGGQLTLASPVPSDKSTLTFEGDVHGSCVDFTIREIGEGYDVSYTFSGVVDGNKISGALTGRGSGVCNFEGDFTTTVFSDGAPRPDGGVLDGSVTSTTGPRECHRNDDCELGVCQSGRCVIVCTEAAECATGQKCISGRCEIARGCNCESTNTAGPFAWISAALGLWLASKRVTARR